MDERNSLPESIVPARTIPIPAHLSPAAQASLIVRDALDLKTFPSLSDEEGWRAYIAQADAALAARFEGVDFETAVDIADRNVGGVPVAEIAPRGQALDRKVILSLHGGALILCGGKLSRAIGIGTALRRRARVWAVDYRMPPAHPYPCALDDCVAAYRALLQERAPDEIVIEGVSAGGNLAAALILRARDEGLPLPAGAILATPQADLTESGDSFYTNAGVDPVLGSLMPVNQLYAGGHDLAHPYLSPLFGDFQKGFPPTILTTGTRDLFLSNTVRLHRALRASSIPAELHVLEGAGHVGFPTAPEQEAIDEEIRRFISALPSPRPASLP